MRARTTVSNRCYVAFWAVALVGLVLVGRWLMRDYADYLLLCDRLRWYVG